MKETYKFSITGADPSYGNRGLGALAYGAMEVIFPAFPDAQLVLVDYYKSEPTLHYTFNDSKKVIKRVGLRFSWKLFLNNNIFILLLGAFTIRHMPIAKIRRFIFMLLPKLEIISKQKIAFSIAGGDSFSDIYGFRTLLYVVLPQLLFILLKIPLIQLPQTIGPFNHRFNSIIAAYILRKSSYIYARDTTSLQLVNRLIGKKGHSKASFSLDVGFLLKPRTVSEMYSTFKDQSELITIGMNISGLLYSKDSSIRFQLSANYKDVCFEIVSHFLNQGNRVILIPHVFDQSIENDISAIINFEKLFTKNENLIGITKSYDSQEIKYIIGKCDFFVGARMHACIGALSQFIPTVPIAYSRKFHGVMKSIKMEHTVFDLRKRLTHETIAHVQNIFESRSSISKLIHEELCNGYLKIETIRNIISNYL